MTPREAADRIESVLDYMEGELADIIIEYHDAELDAIFARLDAIARAYDSEPSVSLSYHLARETQATVAA